MATQARTALRSDARENRARILAVARLAFAADGLEVPIRVIARRVGVGVATVYRHFPTKDDLLVAAFTSRFAPPPELAAERDRAPALAAPVPDRG